VVFARRASNIIKSWDGRHFSLRDIGKSGVIERNSGNEMSKRILPPFGLQRNRNTLERTTIGKPLYFCSAEFVGHFLRSGSGTPLPAKRYFDERVAFVLKISTVAPSAATTKGEPDEQDGHSPRQ
jgi:hypothetical protein